MAHDEDNRLSPAATESLLDAVAPVDPGSAAGRIKKRLMDRVSRSKAAADKNIVTVQGEAGEWIETGPGNAIKILRSDDQTMSMMVRLSPGATFPAHYHPEDEETFVIEGETWFGDTHLVAGDYHHAPKGSTHGEVRTQTGCVLLIRKAAE
ncbi:MAG: cupin domain-containing protein [Pseudomonadota bacterium]